MQVRALEISLATWVVGAATATSSASQSPPVPVYLEPDHHLVFRNNLVRVLDIRVPPHHISKYHVHSNPLVSVTVQDARSWSQKLGEPRGAESPRGEVPSVGDNWDQELPYTHRVGNVDVVGYHRIAAEWLHAPKNACSALDPVAGFELLKDGRFGRIYAMRLAPGQSTPPHVHSCPGLTIQGTDGTLKSVGTLPAAQGGKGAGHWFWRNAGFDHAIRNEGPRPVTVYEIDWR